MHDTGRQHGPTCIPFRNLSGRDEGVPHRPASYGRYEPIDLDENNRFIVDQWCKQHPGAPRPVLGWGVCRSGFGLQRHESVLTREQAERWACELNASIAIGHAV